MVKRQIRRMWFRRQADCKLLASTGLPTAQADDQAVYDELVALVDPGTEPYKPTKGKVNILMAVGIQVCTSDQF